MEVQESFDYATQAAEPEIGKAFQDVYKGRE